MKIAIFSKTENAEGRARGRELKAYLDGEGIESVLLTSDDCEGATVAQIEDLRMCAAMVVFGGDGSVLRAVDAASLANVPILSVNLGDMGFLAELEKTATCEQILDAVKNYSVERRNMIEVTDGEGITVSALNDVVLKSGGQTPVYIYAGIDGEQLDCYRADGVIVSTPTGSTAYALSAGGPVLSPEVNDLVIIPVCPHTLHSRPVVLPFDSTVTLKIQKTGVANLIVDGKFIEAVDAKKTLTVRKSKQVATFLRGENLGFYNRLLRKMNLWGISGR
jgi:NAD+ kinase